MESNVQIESYEGGFSIIGELTFDTVLSAYEQAQSYFQLGQALQIDLQHVTKGDSASLSLLARWMRLAKTQNITLSFLGLPESMRDLGRVSGLDAILPIQPIR
jgi:ABC-type transporter Mla MlaB component